MRNNLFTTSARWGRLSYRKNGEFPGTAIILIHGAIGDSRLFRYQLKYFGDRYKTIAIDLPGHGHSRTGDEPCMDDFITAIEDLRDEEGISSCVLIGHSMGGGVCLEACSRGMPGLKGMVLVSTSPVLPVSPGLVDIIERDDMDALAKLIVSTVFSKGVDVLLGFAKQALNGINREVIKVDIEICKRMDYSRALATIDVPVLVVSNRFDRVIACDATALLHQGIPSSRHIVFNEAGHIPFFENARSFNAAVDSFLEEMGICQ